MAVKTVCVKFGSVRIMCDISTCLLAIFFIMRQQL